MEQINDARCWNAEWNFLDEYRRMKELMKQGDRFAYPMIFGVFPENATKFPGGSAFAAAGWPRFGVPDFALDVYAGSLPWGISKPRAWQISTDYHVYIQNLPALFDEESVEKSYNNNRFLQLSQWVTSHLPSFDRG